MVSIEIGIRAIRMARHTRAGGGRLDDGPGSEGCGG